MKYVECRPISSAEEMKVLADEMIQYAKDHPIDKTGATRAALLGEQSGRLTLEERGPLMRIRGEDMIPMLEQYNRFIFVSQPLQLAYYEYPSDADGPSIKQLTISDLEGNEVDPDVCLLIAEHFINVDALVIEAHTPPHVRVLCQTT